MQRFASFFLVSLVLAISAPASAQRFVERARFTATVAEDLGPTFGAAVAIDGTTVVIGAPGAAGGAGEVHVYDVAGPSPVRLLRFTSTELRELGASVAVRGPLIVAGAPRTVVEGASDAGTVVVLRRGGTAVSVVGRVGIPEASRDGGVLFGSALAISGTDSIVVGAPGARAVFAFDAVSTAPVLRAQTADGDIARYGGVLAAAPIPGTTGVLVAIGSSDPSEVAGVDLWALRAMTAGAIVGTVPNDGGEPGFGRALALDGARLLVGVPARDLVKIYDLDAETGAALFFDSFLGPPSSELGTSVAIHGSLLFGGAPSAGALFGDRGEAFVMRPDALFRLRPAIRTSLPFVQGLGASMSFSGARLLVGAPDSGGEVVLFEDAGATPCSTGVDCSVAEACVDGVCCQTACPTDPDDCATCADETASGWCVLLQAETPCSTFGGACAGTCSGESEICETPACELDGGALEDAGAEDAGAEGDGGAIATDAGQPFDGGAAPPGVSFGGGGGCRCAAAGAGRTTPLTGAAGALLALALAATGLARRRR